MSARYVYVVYSVEEEASFPGSGASRSEFPGDVRSLVVCQFLEDVKEALVEALVRDLDSVQETSLSEFPGYTIEDLKRDAKPHIEELVSAHLAGVFSAEGGKSHPLSLRDVPRAGNRPLRPQREISPDICLAVLERDNRTTLLKILNYVHRQMVRGPAWVWE